MMKRISHVFLLITCLIIVGCGSGNQSKRVDNIDSLIEIQHNKTQGHLPQSKSQQVAEKTIQTFEGMWAIIRNPGTSNEYTKYFIWEGEERLQERIILSKGNIGWNWELLTPGEEISVPVSNASFIGDSLILSVDFYGTQEEISFGWIGRDSLVGVWRFPSFNDFETSSIHSGSPRLRQLKKQFDK